MGIKNTIKNLFHVFRLDVKKYNVHNSEDLLLQAILTNFGIKTVFDVGANTGQYAKGLFKSGFKGKIFSFEPISSVFSVLKKNSLSYPSWQVINSGIGSKEEELKINISENLASSSFLNVTASSLRAEPATKFTRSEVVTISTLDKYVTKNGLPSKPIYLKLDVQGFELEALKGAVSTLPEISVVQAELSFEPLYEGAPLYDEVITFLKNQGFEIFTIIPGFRNPDNGQMLQADGIFYRPNV